MDLTAWGALHILSWLIGTKAAFDLRREFGFDSRTWFLVFWSVLLCLAMETALMAAKAVPGLAAFAAMAGAAAGILTWLGFRGLQEDICQVRARAQDGRLSDFGAAAFSCAVLAGSLAAGFGWPEETMRLARSLEPAVGAVWFAASGSLVIRLAWKACPAAQAEIYRPATLILSFLFALLHSSLPLLAALTGLDIPEEAGAFLGTLFVLTMSVKLYSMVIRVRNQKLADALRQVQDLQEGLYGLEKVAAVGTLAAGAAHDFNNAIAVVIGYVEVLARADLPEPVREHMEDIKRTAWAASAIAANLMGFARRQTGASPYSSLGEAVLAPLHLLGKDLARRGIQVVESVEDTPPVSADLSMISQVCLNLYLNARDAMKSLEGGRLEVAVMRQGEEVEITVSDTGTGIPDDFLPKVFQPFQSTKGDKGTGLGLSVSRSVVNSMGGRMSFETAAGLGTLFRVVLPVAARGPAAGPRESAREAGPGIPDAVAPVHQAPGAQSC